MRKFFAWALVLIVITLIAHFFYLLSKAPKESYPDDTWLNTVTNKTALIIVAHDDDAVSCAGTITRLCKEGWNVKELCFYNTVSDPRSNERIKQRQKDIKKVKEIEGLSRFEYANIPFRNLQLLTAAEYMPVSNEEFSKQYNKDTLLFYIRRFIDDNKPSVIFTLDNNIGGYGHPDHKLVSQLVLDQCTQQAKDSSFTVQYIYQAVFTPSMNDKIAGHLPVYKSALTTYRIKGPLPNVQINITANGSEKKKVMQTYITEQNSIRKFWPYYQYYPAAIYFRIFNREFFNVIQVK